MKPKALATVADTAKVLELERARIATALAVRQQEIEADAVPEALAEIVVASDDDYRIVTELRTQARAERDALVKLRQDAAGPWKKVATTIEEMFRPSIRGLETIEAHMRAELEKHVVAKAQAEKAAREAAIEAAQAGDDGAMVEALNQSIELATPLGGGRQAMRWAVKRVAEDMLPDEYWTPDLAKLEAVAKAHKGDDPPVVPGVIFEQVASVAVRR
jgi:hypothetical protein